MMTNDATQTIAEAKRRIDAKRSADAIAILPSDLTSKNPEAAYLLGVAYFRLKAFTEAERAFRLSVSLNPGNHLAVYYLGLSLERQGSHDTALEAYRTAVKLEPAFADGHRKLEELGVSPPPSPQESAPVRSAPMSEFTIPDGPDELDVYMDRKLKRARAEYGLEWRATPLPIKIISLLILSLVIAGIAAAWAFIAYQIISGS